MPGLVPRRVYAHPVPHPSPIRSVALWLGGAVLIAVLTVVAALVLLPEFDLLARNYPVL